MRAWGSETKFHKVPCCSTSMLAGTSKNGTPHVSNNFNSPRLPGVPGWKYLRRYLKRKNMPQTPKHQQVWLAKTVDLKNWIMVHRFFTIWKCLEITISIHLKLAVWDSKSRKSSTFRWCFFCSTAMWFFFGGGVASDWNRPNNFSKTPSEAAIGPSNGWDFEPVYQGVLKAQELRWCALFREWFFQGQYRRVYP